MWCEEGASCWLKEEVGWGQAPYGSPSRGLWRGVPYSGLSHGTHRSLLVGRLLLLGWRLWWVLPWALWPPVAWAQPAVTLYFSPPLVAGPRYEPLHREKVAPNCRPQQAKS